MTQYYRSLLSGTDALTYDRILSSWRRMSPRVVLGPCNNERNIPTIVEFVAWDHPEVFFLSYNRFEVIKAPLWTKLQFSLLYSEQEIQAIQQSIKELKSYIGRFVPVQADRVEKVWMIFDFLSRQIEYGECGPNSHSIVGCLPEYGHIAVCEGIAKTFKLLCDTNGIPCIIVTGVVKGERHAWNIVQLGDKCNRHIDATAQIRYAHTFGKAQIRGFLKRDSEMSSFYHWDKHLYPTCR